MGQFRDLMTRDLQIRGYSVNTQKAYLGWVKDFVRHFMRPPDELSLEDIHNYQLHLTRERRLKWSSFNQAVCALRFFFRVTLNKDWDIRQIPYQKTGRKLPEILSGQEVCALIEAPTNIKHRAILMTLYASGVRLEEVVNLRITDIDSQRMVIRVEQGKGRKDRYTVLSETLVGVLREYWKLERPDHWLFPGQIPSKPLTRSSVQRVFKKARQTAGVSKPVTVHSMRHTFATHLLEDGVNIRVIQRLLGHKSLRSTEIYTHVASNYLTDTPSPLEGIKDLLGAVPQATG